MLRLLFLFIFLSLTAHLSSQTTLRFSGLERTQLAYFSSRINGLKLEQQGKKDRVVLQSNIIDRDALDELRQQLVNLPAITEADYNWEVANGDSSLHWTIKESRTLFPLINFGGIKGNIHYLLGFNDIHWRGRGQVLSAYYQNNSGEHNFSLSLRNPSLRGGKWGYGLEVRRYAAVEPVYFQEGSTDYLYANLGVGTSLMYSPAPRQTFSLGFNAFRERYEKQNPAELVGIGPESLELHKVSLKGGFGINRINFLKERRSGWDFKTNGQLVHNLNDGTNFLILLNELRYYSLLGRDGNLAARFQSGISSNEQSPFAPFTVDSQINIRGSGNRIDRGTALFVLNLEYRHTVWRTAKGHFSGQLVGFSDFGTWRSPGGNFEELIEGDSIRHFVGGGLRIISSSAKNAVIRIDYGLDVRNQGERGIVVGFGQYF